MTIRILVVDDHALVRAGLRRLVASFDDCDVVGEAADGREALRQARLLNPDVVLLDISMPGLNGIDCVVQLLQEAPDSRAILLSMHSTEEFVLAGVRAGAHGYVLKESAPDELEAAIRAVAAGGRYVSPRITVHLVAGVRGGDQPGDKMTTLLTPRQRETLQLIAEGHSSREIGKRLHLSVKTVDGHRSEIMRRLDIHDVASLTRFAIRMGITKLE